MSRQPCPRSTPPRACLCRRQPRDCNLRAVPGRWYPPALHTALGRGGMLNSVVLYRHRVVGMLPPLARRRGKGGDVQPQCSQAHSVATPAGAGSKPFRSAPLISSSKQRSISLALVWRTSLKVESRMFILRAIAVESDLHWRSDLAACM